MFSPLVRVPSAHRRNPLSFGDVLSPGSERLLDFTNRSRVLEDRVIAGPVSQTDNVDMRFNQPRHNRFPLEVDNTSARLSRWTRIANGGKTSITDCDSAREGVLCVHCVNPAVDEDQVGFGRTAHYRHLRDGHFGSGGAARSYRCTRGCSQEITTRQVMFAHS